ncbi:class III lanthipeptide [Lysinibacillus sphaericus]|nr:class III lanthipeptide [Lysinibacillus sphaericus]MCS1382964.1 class III lanthipeptide [Lysinibacillus sphaericus]
MNAVLELQKLVPDTGKGQVLNATVTTVTTVTTVGKSTLSLFRC